MFNGEITRVQLETVYPEWNKNVRLHFSSLSESQSLSFTSSVDFYVKIYNGEVSRLQLTSGIHKHFMLNEQTMKHDFISKCGVSLEILFTFHRKIFKGEMFNGEITNVQLESVYPG